MTMGSPKNSLRLLRDPECQNNPVLQDTYMSTLEASVPFALLSKFVQHESTQKLFYDILDSIQDTPFIQQAHTSYLTEFHTSHVAQNAV